MHQTDTIKQIAEALFPAACLTLRSASKLHSRAISDCRKLYRERWQYHQSLDMFRVNIDYCNDDYVYRWFSIHEVIIRVGSVSIVGYEM